MPLMDLSAVGRTTSTTIVGGAYQMWVEGEPIVGVLIAFCAVLAPGAFLLFMLILLLAARRTPPPHWVAEMLRWAHHFEMWSMLEVMMLGILVALIKIAEVATVEAGIGMYAVFALMRAHSVDPRHVRCARALVPRRMARRPSAVGARRARRVAETRR